MNCGVKMTPFLKACRALHVARKTALLRRIKQASNAGFVWPTPTKRRGGRSKYGYMKLREAAL